MVTLTTNGCNSVNELPDDSVGQIGYGFFRQEFVAGAFYFQECWLDGNQLEGGLHLIGRSEGITAPVDKECRCGEAGEVGGAGGLGLAWRMQWIRQKEQPSNQRWLFGSQHGGLPSSV